MIGKLNSGQPVHVALVGGSVTWGQGAVHGGSFGRRFFTWLNATWPGAPHRLTNAANPSITSSLYALCGNDMIPQVGGRQGCSWLPTADQCIIGQAWECSE